MIIFLDPSGNSIEASQSGQIGRNSNDAASIYIVSAMPSSAQIYLTFKLPNGQTLFGGLADKDATQPEDEAPQSASPLFTVGDLSVWLYKLRSPVTMYAGKVEYTVVSIREGGVVTTASGSFTVAKGNKLALPKMPTGEGVLDAVLSRISEFEGDLTELYDKNASNAKNISEIKEDLKSNVARRVDGDFSQTSEELELDLVNSEGVEIASTSVKIPVSEIAKGEINKRFPGTESTIRHVRIVTKDGEALMQVSYSGESHDIPKNEFTIPVRRETGNIFVPKEQWLEDSRDQWNDRNAASIALVKKTHEATFRLPRDHSLDRPWEEKIEDFPSAYIKNVTALIPAVDGINSDGDQTFIFASDYYDPLPSGDDGEVKKEATIVMRDYEYPTCICTDLPQKEYHAVPKEYVDGLRLVVSLDEETYKVSFSLTNKDGEILGNAAEIDLPLESLIKGVSITESGDKFILELQGGKTVEITAANLVKGLVTTDALDKALKEKLDKSDITYEVGTSNDKVMSQKAVTDALDTKVPNLGANPYGGTRVYCWFGNGDRSTLKVNNNNEKSTIPIYSDPSADYGKVSNKTNGCLVTGTPIHPYHAANMKYVDDLVKPVNSRLDTLDFSVKNAFGVQVFTKTLSGVLPGGDVGIVDFPGTYPFIYVKKAILEVQFTSLEDFIATYDIFPVTRVACLNDFEGIIAEVDIEQGGYIQVPDKTDHIMLFAPDYDTPDGYYVTGSGFKYEFIYQTKVGG